MTTGPKHVADGVGTRRASGAGSTEALTGTEALGWIETPAEARVAELRAAEVGTRVAKLRRRAGMSRERLGSLTGLTDRITAIEAGRRRLDVGELSRVAAALGVTVRRLLGRPNLSDEEKS